MLTIINNDQGESVSTIQLIIKTEVLKQKTKATC